MTTQHDLGRAFAEGATSGEASNVSIRNNLLVGYGWAIYAERRPDGAIRFNDGWRGYSMSTTCQMTKLLGGVISAGATVVHCDLAPPRRP